jgi:hypothetical protein
MAFNISWFLRLWLAQIDRSEEGPISLVHPRSRILHDGRAQFRNWWWQRVAHVTELNRKAADDHTFGESVKTEGTVRDEAAFHARHAGAGEMTIVPDAVEGLQGTRRAHRHAVAHDEAISTGEVLACVAPHNLVIHFRKCISSRYRTHAAIADKNVRANAKHAYRRPDTRHKSSADLPRRNIFSCVESAA